MCARKAKTPPTFALFGQEKMGTTWSICKMNMLLHGIPDADIRQQDTLREPQHKDETNQLRRFDRVLANPPFSQNYIKKDMQFPGRFPVWMPEKGKKADLMFVQHMLAVLKSRWSHGHRHAARRAVSRWRRARGAQTLY